MAQWQISMNATALSQPAGPDSRFGLPGDEFWVGWSRENRPYVLPSGHARIPRLRRHEAI